MSSSERQRQETLLAKERASSLQANKQRPRLCMQASDDIHTILEVQTSKMVEALCEFLERYTPRARRVIVSHEDAERVWKACRRGDRTQLRELRGELVDARRCPTSVSTAAELSAYEKDFMDRFGGQFRRHVAFECSMLQTAEEDEQGRVSWRDLTCGDGDNFCEVMNFAMVASDLTRFDQVMLVPPGDQIQWQSPLDMISSPMGPDVADKKLGTVVHVKDLSESTVLSRSRVCGRTSRYQSRIADCTRSKLKLRGESAGASLMPSQGRPAKRIPDDRHSAGKTDTVVVKVELPGVCQELRLDRPADETSVSSRGLCVLTQPLLNSAAIVAKGQICASF